MRLTVVLAMGVVVCARYLDLEPLAPFERRLHDSVLLPLLPASPTSDDVALVVIDDRAIVEGAERWPFSRATWAKFLTHLAAVEPRAIALDVVFDQDSQAPLRELAERVRQRTTEAGLGASTALMRVFEIIDEVVLGLDGDLQLSRALARAGNVTLGLMLSDRPPPPLAPPEPVDPVAALDLALPIAPAQVPELALDLPTLVRSTPRLFLAARTHGTMNVLLDPDGVVRRYPIVAASRGVPIPSLALAVRVSDLTRGDSLPIIQAALAADGAAPLLRFRPPDRPFPTVSFVDVLNEDPKALGPLLRGKVVFVGTTAAGVEDLLHTAARRRIAGVEVHASAYENLVARGWLESRGAGIAVGLASTLVLLGGFAYLLRRRLKARWIWACALGCASLHLVVAVLVASGAGWLIALAPTPLGIAALGVLEAGHRWRWARTEHLRLEERERVLEAERAALERFRAVVEHVADAIVSVDDAQRIRWMNPAAESLFQRRARTAVDRPVGELIARVRSDETLGEVLAAEARVGAEVVPVEATATHMRVGGEQYTNFVFRDVAARKALERQKDDFIASINHELRTPITSILGSLRLINAGAVGETSERVRELLVIAEKNGDRLLSLVTDLLDAAKLDAGRLSLEKKPTPLGELVRDAVERCRGFGLQYDVAVVVAPTSDAVEDAVVDVDKERIVQVVGNLVSNAVKHSEAKATVLVSVMLEAGRTRVLVSDSGPGIPEEFHDRLFERFTMTTARDGKRRPGTGIGLAIAKGLVDAHGGSIGFESRVGHGTTFWFELPTLA